LAFVYGSVEESYRQTADLINRVRHQPAATPARTIHEQVEAEGEKIAAHMEKKVERILTKEGLSAKSGLESKSKYGVKKRYLKDKRLVAKAIIKCAEDKKMLKQMQANLVPYENAARSVNISVDDVGVKRQKDNRVKESGELLVPNKSATTDTKYVHNTIVHLQTEESKYAFNGQGTVNTLVMVIAFLFSNKLLNNNLIFFVDGQKTLHAAIINLFAIFRDIQLILDWYHLEKKCKEQLSLGLRGSIRRNEVLEQLMPLLWHGGVEAAIRYLHTIKPSWIKDIERIDQLIEYLQRNKPFIPCYCVRKELGLRNSSNLGEKLNDLIVSDRQKHNGMSWSKSGSRALASLTVLVKNNEAHSWFRTKRITFKLVA
jgi:hypothetical protein